MSDLITTNNQLTTTGPRWLVANDPDQALDLPLGDLVRVFLNAAAPDNPNTAKAYQTAVGLFLEFMGTELANLLPDNVLPLANATKDGKRTVWEFRGSAAVLRRFIRSGVVDNFAVARRLAGDAPKTIKQRRGGVNAFLEVAYREGVLTDAQAQPMGLKHYTRHERQNAQPVGRRLAKEEVRALRETILLKARQETKAIRDRAIIDIMLFAGLRREEVATLRTSEFRTDAGRWWIFVTGKGGKTRRVKLHDTLYKSLLNWCQRVDMTLGVGDEPLFCNLNRWGKSTGHQLAGCVIGRLVAEYGHLAGLAAAAGENVLSPHDLRRTCARNAYDNGATIAQVQNMLGHADPKTTMLYIGSMENDDNTAVDFVRYDR